MYQGQQFYLRLTGNDVDGNLSMFYIRYMNPSGVETDFNLGASGYTSTQDVGPMTLDQVGVWNLWAHIADAGGLWKDFFSSAQFGTFSINVVPQPGTPPSFNLHPQPQSLIVGQNMVLQSDAAGSPSPSYQWYKDAVPISGATSSTYVLNNVQKSNAGTYFVRASNSQGQIDSNAVSVTISHPVLLSSYSFHGYDLPIISTNEVLAYQYRLRCKFLDGSYYGYHAATTYNNNGLRLDSVPSANAYDVQLYWLKYDASGTNLLEIGPIEVRAVTVAQIPIYSIYVAGGVFANGNSSISAAQGTMLEIIPSGLQAGYGLAGWSVDGPGTVSADNRFFTVGAGNANLAANIRDIQPPGDFTVAVNERRTNSATVFWTSAMDNVGVVAYELRLNSSVLSSQASSPFALTGLNPAGAYQVDIVARDAAGNTRAASAAFSALSADGDEDGDGLRNSEEEQVGLNPLVADVDHRSFTYDKANQLKTSPDGEYAKDAEGNIKEVKK
jgi:hypothetical protein